MGALFDLSFTKFISPTIAKIVYIIGMVVIAIMYLTFVVAAFDADALFGILTLLVIGPLAALLYLCFLRVGLESLLAMILTAQNTAEMVRLNGGTPPSGMAFPSGPSPSTPPAGSYPPPSSTQTPPAGPPTPPPPGAPPVA